MKTRFAGVMIVLMVGMAGSGCNDDNSAKPKSHTGSVTQDAWCKEQPSICCDECIVEGSLVLTISGASTTATGAATLTIDISGDLDDTASEFLHIMVEGADLGTVFNGNSGDDEFDLPGDTAVDCTPTTMHATIPETVLAGIISDGMVVVTVTSGPGSGIEDEGCPDTNDETITVKISYPIE
jgi:hypothetical protein